MSLRHAILGFLDLEATTGYTLKQRFEGSVGSFWSATQSQIYKELHGLERDGQVRVEVVPQDGKPARKVYALTPSGRKALGEWLKEPIGPPQLRDPLLLKLVFAKDVEPAAFDAVLQRYGDELAATHAEYTARLASPAIFSLARSPRERTLWQLSLENGLRWCEALMDWTADARRRLGPAPKKQRKVR